MADDQQLRLRADARRNRDSILWAAKMLFATQGPETTAEEIARAAGVSQGTLYRHFADREALIRATARHILDGALRQAESAVAEEPTAWDALVRILRASHELRAGFRLLVAHPDVHAIMRKERAAEQNKRIMLEVLDRVVAKAQAEGSLRTDVGAGDIAVMFALLAHPLPPSCSDAAELASERCLALLLESLRPTGGGELPGRPLRPSDIYQDVYQPDPDGS